MDYKKTATHNFPNMELMSNYESDSGKGGIRLLKPVNRLH